MEQLNTVCRAKRLKSHSTSPHSPDRGESTGTINSVPCTTDAAGDASTAVHPPVVSVVAVSLIRDLLDTSTDSDSFTSTPRPVSTSHCRLEPSSLPLVHLPQSVVHDEEEYEGDKELSAPSDATVLPPLVFPDDRRRSKVQLDSMQQQHQHEAPPKSPRVVTPPRAQGSTRSLYQKKLSSGEFHSSTPVLVTTVVSQADLDTVDRVAEVSPRMIRQKTFVAGARRATVSVDGVSHHALDRLGVNADILRKEKGMKKLGISDVDIVRSEELRRYTGIATKKMARNKVELVFGFTGEQLQRDKAVKRLGTSEQEIFDDYCRRVSLLGVHEQPMASF